MSETEYFEEDGFLTFLSGGTFTGTRLFSGVGFIVAPWAKTSIISFKGIADRLACLRVKVSGGVLNVYSAYAPHDGIDFNIRHEFFTLLGENTRRHHNHETSVVCGDLNAQFGNVKEGESKIIGPYVYQKVLCDDSNRIPNRALLLEYCGAYDMMAINTYFQYPEYYLVTYRNLVTCPFDNVFDGGFSQIDHILCHQNNADMMYDCWSCRNFPLNSHHFPVIVLLQLEFPKSQQKVQSQWGSSWVI